MFHLDLYDVLAIAARVRRIDARAVVRSTDLDAIDRALATTRLDDPSEAAAGLLIGLIREKPFERDNRLVAVAVALQFLGLNGFDLRLEPGADLDDLLDRIADGRAGQREITNIIRSVLSERPRPVWSDLEALGEQEDAMFELFSDSARRAIVLAQDEARNLQHNYVGTEHVLLGLLEEGGNVAAKVLTTAGVSAPAVRALVLEIIGRGNGTPSGHITFTPRTKRVLELTRAEARNLGSEEFRPEHLLLGLLAEGQGVACQALTKLGADSNRLRRQLLDETDSRRRAESVVRTFLTEGAEPGSWLPHKRRTRLLAEVTAVLDENDRLQAEITRLRSKLLANKVDPDT